jgi:hypothetical protein
MDRPWLEPRVGVTRLPMVELPLRATPAEPGLRVSVTLLCWMPLAGQVRLSVLDQSGRSVRTLVQGWMTAGEHAIAWDQRDDRGRKVYAGLYRARFEAAGRTMNQQVMLMP